MTNIHPPNKYVELLEETNRINFSMLSDGLTGSLIRSLVSSKPNGRFLDLGTGTGLSISWMLDGMSKDASVISIDNDKNLTNIAHSFFGGDPRVELLCTDAEAWINAYQGVAFDLIFADAWPGKYNSLDLILDQVIPGGFYLIDDMLPQDNWPENHHLKAKELISTLEQRNDFFMTKMDWSTGVILLTRKLL